MKKSFIVFIAIMVLCSIQSFAISSQNSNDEITGNWLGTLNISTVQLRIVFHIKNENGNLTATMDSPDQGAKGIPVNQVVYKDGKLVLDVKAVRGTYEGKLNSDKTELDGNWKQAGMILPLKLKKVDKVEEAKRPQEPKPPFPYEVKDVSYKNESAGITLAGTLTMPKTGGPFPAVILITGSGPQNRDEEIFNHKPFLVIADYLTRRGIAVLRFDDRGVGKSTGKFKDATTADFATDVLAGVKYLKTLKEINPKEIGLIGHSEGGEIAPMVASKSSDVAFIVLLAGPGLKGSEILLKQGALIQKLSGMSEDEIEKDSTFKSKIFKIVEAGKNEETTKEEIKKAVDNYYDSLSEKTKENIGSKGLYEKQFTNTFSSPWMKYFLNYNPIPALEKVKCPVLALNGSKDVQVPPKEDLAGIKEALEKGGNKNFEVKEIPGLNHLFQEAKTGAPSEYASIEQTFSPKALKIIGDWILKIVKDKK